MKKWLKKQKKDLKKTLPLVSLGMLGGFVVFMLSFSIFALLIDNFPARLAFGYFDKVGQKDNMVSVVSEICDNSYITNTQKAKCVVSFYERHYDYTMRNGTTILSATEFYENGGVCRDFAVNVCATIRKLGLDCGYGFGNNHVFPIIQFKEGDKYNYCLYDGGFWCMDSGEYIGCDGESMSCTEDEVY